MRAENQVSAQTSTGGAQNVVDLLIERAASAAKPGATQKVNGRWEDVSWGKILEEVKSLSAGLVAQGVKPGDRVAIFANTSLEWLMCDLAISAAQGITVPIYASNTPDEVRYILNDSESMLLFVDNDEKEAKQPGRLTRVRQRLAQCPTVKKVVIFNGVPQGPQELTLADVRSQGEATHKANPAAFEQRVQAVKTDDPCCFLYTSGTTGDPKGVILTHGNWTYEAFGVKQAGLMTPEDAVMLFLPLAHSFAQVVKAAWLSMGFRMIFAESVDKLLGNLAETKPTVLPSVPRVFEKVYNKVLSDGTSQPGIKGKMARWAFRLFDEYVEARIQGREYSNVGWTLAKKLVFHGKIQPALTEKLGGHMRLFVSGGAPLSKKIAYFFDLLGFKVLEGYGLTETAAGTTVNRPERIKIGTVGAPFVNTEIKIAPDGEILLRGPGVMKGYYKKPEATAEALTPDGWFHTGDIGELDADNFLRITDRKKDIIVTAGGKNVAPQNLENILKTFPLISQAMVVGDKRKYLIVLVTVNEEIARKLLADKGLSAGSYAEVAKHPEIHAAVQDIINKVNSEQPPYNTLKRFAVMEADFSQETGEITPTLKVKRKYCTTKYAKQIDTLYDNERVD
ncbi:MAG TPA: long-chain fatty acid--CoA ligase [Aggregicoccus sp.]|nr:long-chain fatty acid--CoA ligase [Aggregicoccus sp.]